MDTTSTRYLSGCSGPYLEGEVAATWNIGLLVQPRTCSGTDRSYSRRTVLYPFWAGDNGAFCRDEGFNPELFRAMLADPDLQADRARCLWIAAPDAIKVLPGGDVEGDPVATLEQYPAWEAEIRAAGFPVALVAQDGLEYLMDQVPWDSVDAIFLGGSTAWKEGPGAAAVAAEARAHGKLVHMGRVNSGRRLQIAADFQAHTADGTFLGFAPANNLPRMLRWLRSLEERLGEQGPVTPAAGCSACGAPVTHQLTYQARGATSTVWACSAHVDRVAAHLMAGGASSVQATVNAH